MILTITLKHDLHISEYTLHGNKITSVTNAKYLGINFDSKLTFNHHVNSVCQKAITTLLHFYVEILDTVIKELS